MNNLQKNHARNQRLTMFALLIALVIVLQLITVGMAFTGFSITLSLVPIIVGAALYGQWAGAFLGFLFGLVVYVTGLMGMDGGGINTMMQYNWWATTILCLGKGAVAGFCSGIVYKLLQKKKTLAAILGSITAPIVNTGIFAVGMITIFYGFLAGPNPSSNPVIGPFLLSLLSINFLIEFIAVLAFSFVLPRIADYFNKKYKKA